MFDTEPFMKWTQTSISLTNYQMGQLDCGAKTNVCQAKTYQNHGEQRSLTRAYHYHITFVARLSSRKAFINRRLGCGGAVVRALASHQCGPESYPDIDAICGLSLLLVLSLVMRGFFPGTPVFPSPQEPTFPNYNSTRNQVYEEPLCGCATSKSLFIYLLTYGSAVFTKVDNSCITASELNIHLHITRKPKSIIVLLFIKNIS